MRSSTETMHCTDRSPDAQPCWRQRTVLTSSCAPSDKTASKPLHCNLEWSHNLTRACLLQVFTLYNQVYMLPPNQSVAAAAASSRAATAPSDSSSSTSIFTGQGDRNTGSSSSTGFGLEQVPTSPPGTGLVFSTLAAHNPVCLRIYRTIPAQAICSE